MLDMKFTVFEVLLALFAEVSMVYYVIDGSNGWTLGL